MIQRVKWSILTAILGDKTTPLEESVSWAIQKNDIKTLNYWCIKGDFTPQIKLLDLITAAEEGKESETLDKKEEDKESADTADTSSPDVHEVSLHDSKSPPHIPPTILPTHGTEG